MIPDLIKAAEMQVVCPGCGQIKPLEQFYTVTGKCSECAEGQKRKWDPYPICKRPGCADGKHFHVPVLKG